MRSLRRSLILSAFLLPACTEPAPGTDDDDGTSSGGTEDGSGTGDAGGSTGGDSGGDDGSDSTTTGDDGGDTTDTGGTGDTTGATDGTTSALECTGTCVDEAPQGWYGPIAIAQAAGDTAPGCGGDYPTDAFTAYDTLNVPGGSCDCTCGAPQGTTCPAEVDVSYGNADGSCEDIIVTSIDATCNVLTPVPVETDNKWWRVVEVTPSGGTCTPNLVPDLGAPSWDAAFSGCEGDLAEGTCEDAEDLCVSPPAEPLSEVICIWQAGDTECPQGDYSVKTLLHDGFTDTRDCEACLCGDPTGTCTEPVVRMHAQNNCPCVTAACDFGYTCKETPYSTVVYGLELRTLPTVDTAWCTPSDPQVTGDATADDPRTLCCTA
jgi:hypothetical protein